MLFLRDKFSEIGPKWKPLDSDGDIYFEKIKEIIHKHFNDYTGEIKNIFKVDGLEVNSSNYLVEGKLNKIIIKLVSNDNYKKFTSQLFLYKSIEEYNLPIPALIGHSKISNNKKSLFAFEYIDGKYFSGRGTELSLTADSIIRLQAGLNKFSHKNFFELPLFDIESKNIFDDFILIADSWDNIFKKEEIINLKKNIPLIKDAQNFCCENISKLQSVNKSIFHIDLHPHNILIKSDKVVIIDIDSIMISRWPVALGFAFFKLTRQVISFNKYNDMPIQLFLENLIRPYSDSFLQKDLELLFLGGLSEIMRRLFIILAGNLNNQVSPWNNVLNIQINSISELLFLASKFLDSNSDIIRLAKLSNVRKS